MNPEGKAERNSGQYGWESFLREPAAYADPERLALCFMGKISNRACERLLANGRLHGRLSTLLAEYYALARLPDDDAHTADNADRRIALWNVDRLSNLILQSGAIYWSDVLASTILGREAAALRAVFNGELTTFAVANKDLAGPPQPIEPIETLKERVEADGWRCLAAWCHAVDPAIGARFRLKLPPTTPLEEIPAPPFVETGPEIVRRAAR
ncbi:Yop proteins translocation protein K [Chelativorans salis]|uniref:Yop proteins translocation protein K n=1 Tax=Chelativorans salis TaxID=2978478 RepID=A0ABT2LQK3_9HYPH|nr:Yop proteins translocation protein K [Chelativorans sp. EGI FJ00035]MCT7376836.1 Yop proteins translocation protein K [Chelativorans sp. EGI FJ00035]